MNFMAKKASMAFRPTEQLTPKQQKLAREWAISEIIAIHPEIKKQIEKVKNQGKK